MYAKISYEYSTLDNQHEFNIRSPHAWVWYYLGRKLQSARIKEKPGFLIIYESTIDLQENEIITDSDCEIVAEKLVKFIKSKIK